MVIADKGLLGDGDDDDRFGSSMLRHLSNHLARLCRQFRIMDNAVTVMN